MKKVALLFIIFLSLSINAQDIQKLADIAHYIFQRKNIDEVYSQELIENMKSRNLQKPDSSSFLKKITAEIEIHDNALAQKLPLLGIAQNGIAGMGLKLILEQNERN